MTSRTHTPEDIQKITEPWSPVSIGVDVTEEGAHVVGIYALDNDTSQIFYSKFYPAPQRKPLTDEEIWVLTSEYNDYDQHGEYFEAVFIGKPTSEQIQKHCHVTEQGAVHILNGGGRVKYEDQWYNLRKEKAAHGIKGEA